MINGSEVFSGYLDVKVSARSRRGFTPWKAWHKQWCEIRRLDCMRNGAMLVLKTASEGSVINSVTLPRSSTVCRIESHTKNYAFGVFTLGRNQKPILFLSGGSETDTQKWMAYIRRTLMVASYIPVGGLSFHVSLVDNDHSRAARLSGLFGILSVNPQEILISDPITGEVVIKWSWINFHQFHLQAHAHPDDENTICVMHTSKEFPSGAGEIYFYCEDAPQLLELLVTRGKSLKLNSLFAISQRLSQSESDLNKSNDASYLLRHFSNSDDSGVRVSLSSDDYGCRVKSKTLSMNGLLSKTPGGSETEDDDFDVNNHLHGESKMPRGESGVSLASGVYEEIPELLSDLSQPKAMSTSLNLYTNGHMIHLYEDPEEVTASILRKYGKVCAPPPLPPRFHSNLDKDCDINGITTPTSVAKLSTNFISMCNFQKYRSNTLPAKDLRRLSQTFSCDSDYMVMTPKNKKKTKDSIVAENVYVPMSPIASFKTKLENCYMVMSGKKC